MTRRPVPAPAATRPPRRLLLAATLVAAALLGALGPGAAARAADVGIADQKAAVFADARLRALDLGYARLIVPWDAATSEPDAVAAWLAATQAAGLTPHVAFEHLRTDDCPGSPCVLPSTARYAGAVRAFIARFPQVRTYTTWNEANHVSQPVAQRPQAAAAYYDALVAACPGCTVVAGDVLDSGNYVRWLRSFAAATSGDPQLWGLHDYGDVTYDRTTGVDAVLATVPGRLWIEETGGLVTLRNAAWRTTFSATEADAAQALTRAFAIAAARPRIDRMYVYQWQAKALDRFDAGLVRPDGATRPSYDALLAGLSRLRSAGTTAAAGTVPKLRWRLGWSRTNAKQLLLQATCRAPDRRCTGTVTVTVRTRSRAGARTHVKRLVARSYRTTAKARTATLRITVPKALRSRIRKARTRRLVVAAKPTRPISAAASTTLRLAKPR